MAYGIIHFYPNGTKAQYDAEIAVAHPHGWGMNFGLNLTIP